MRLFLILAVTVTSTFRQDCLPDTYRTRGCSGDDVTLSCPVAGGFENIQIQEAFYGIDLTSSRECSDGEWPSCLWPDLVPSHTYVQGMCNGINPCTIKVHSPNPFPYVCRTGAMAQFRVEYKCCRADVSTTGCQKRFKTIRPRLNERCKSKYPVYVGWCEGTCPSLEKLNLVTRRWYRKCDCCRDSGSGSGRRYSYPIFLQCDTTELQAQETSLPPTLQCMVDCMPISMDEAIRIYGKCGLDPSCWLADAGRRVLACEWNCFVPRDVLGDYGHVARAYVADIQGCECKACP